MKQIFLCKSGSHVYGTNTPASDDDYRGIFVADPKFIRTPYHNIYEYRDPNEKDSVSYELSKFMQLYTDCNPNIVEFLWIDESDILVTSPAYELLRKYRYELLSSKAALTFSSYAISQMKSMVNKSKWENNPQTKEPPRQTKYVSLVVNYTDEKIFSINIEDYGDGYQLVHYGSNIYGVYKSVGHTTYNRKYTLNMNSEHFNHTDDEGNRRIPLFVVKFNIDEYKKDLDTWTNYWEWRNKKDKKIRLYELIGIELANRTEDGTEPYQGIDAVVNNDDMESLVKRLSTENLTDHLHLCKRHYDFKENNMDTKAGMHLVRIMRMCVEMLRDGVVNVKRPDAQELLDIRNGKWTYEELIKYGEETDKYVKEVLYPNTKLRNKPDIDLATSLILQIQDMVW